MGNSKALSRRSVGHCTGPQEARTLPKAMQGCDRCSATYTGSEEKAEPEYSQRGNTCQEYAEGHGIEALAALHLHRQISKSGSFVKTRHSVHKERNGNAHHMQRCSRRSSATLRRTAMKRLHVQQTYIREQI